jgi:hypothetical protein
MKRRTAIRRIFIFSSLSAVSLTGFKLHSLFKKPDLRKLDNFAPLINAIANTIIPETDTPGAGSAKVGTIILKMIKYCTKRQSQNNFIIGLEETAELSIRKYGLPFEDCKIDQKLNILKTFNVGNKGNRNLMGKVKTKLFGQPYISLLKEYTAHGYCTSMMGATLGLSYDPVPEKYKGCVPLAKDQIAWATK